jgi:hypothetical protein
MKEKLTGSPTYVCPQARAAFGWGWGGTFHITVRRAAGGNHRTPQVLVHLLSGDKMYLILASKIVRDSEARIAHGIHSRLGSTFHTCFHIDVENVYSPAAPIMSNSQCLAPHLCLVYFSPGRNCSGLETRTAPPSSSSCPRVPPGKFGILVCVIQLQGRSADKCVPDFVCLPRL